MKFGEKRCFVFSNDFSNDFGAGKLSKKIIFFTFLGILDTIIVEVISMKLVQQQEQRLILTKQLTQAIELLQYTALEVQEFLAEQVLENPFITIKERRKKSSSHELVHNISSKQLSLADYLLEQLGLMKLTEQEKKIATYIALSLDDHGFLRMSIDEICLDVSISEQAAMDVLEIIQSLEPAGVGARSVQETLYLQLIRKPCREELAERMIQEHFQLFVEKSVKTLARLLGVSTLEIQRAFDCIQQLQPYPCAGFLKQEANYVVPDVMLVFDDDSFKVTLNEQLIPTLAWNESYEKRLRFGEDTETNEFIQQKQRQYHWIIGALKQRNETLLLVTKAIVAHQKKAFTLGLASLRPLTMTEIARQIGIHESTVSRTVRNKYAQTPLGLVKLRSFFSSGLSQQGEEDASTSKIKQLIRELIETENKNSPLSDQKLVDILVGKYKIHVARRTVTKYREQLMIPSSTKRRRFDG